MCSFRGSLSNTAGVHIRRGGLRHRHAPRAHVKIETKDGPLQANKRGLKRNQAGPHTDLRLPDFRTVSNTFPLFKPPSVWYFHRTLAN